MSKWMITLFSVCALAFFAAPLAAQEGAPAADAAPEATLAALSGSYSYAGGKKQKEKVEAQVEELVEEVNFVIRSFARDALQKVSAPYKKLEIKVDGDNVTIKSDRHGPWSGKLGQTFSAKNSKGDPVKVTWKQKGDALVENIKGENGTVRRVYKLGKNGKSMRMNVTLKSSRLPKPLKYGHGYRK